MADDTVRYIFLLSALLLIVAYFAGFSSDVTAFASGATSLVYAVTGRNSKGAFTGYPSGGGSKGGKIGG